MTMPLSFDHWRNLALFMATLLAASAGIVSACSASGGSIGGGPGPGASPGAGSGGASGNVVTKIVDTTNPTGTVIAPKKECNPCTDFQVVTQPMVVEGTAYDVSQFPAFTGQVSGGPCISDPPNGALFPYNWTRPRIKWAATGASVYEVRLSTPRESGEFVAYTNKPEFYLPRAVWSGDATQGTKGLAANAWGEEITVTVRVPGGAGSQVVFQTAPVPAGGSLVYWVTNLELEAANNGKLMGFAVGDESSVDALTIAQVKMPTYDQGGNQQKTDPKTRCIGCHTSTPDGTAVAFNDGWPWNGMIAMVTPDQTGAMPSYLTPGGRVVLNMPWQGIMTFSKTHWSDSERLVITTNQQTPPITWQSTNPGNNNETTSAVLMWMDLATPRPTAAEADFLGTQTWQLQQNVFPQLSGTAFGIVARTGDSRAAVMPDWSHDGTQIVYTSSSTARDGHVGMGNDTDIYLVPFNDRLGGEARPLTGAAQTGVAEYYPDFSADDQLVAFNRLPSVPTAAVYSRREGEIWITPVTPGAVTAAAGETDVGGAIRLRANDPHQCSNETSPGLLNSWPKWSPSSYFVEETNTRYYWLVFSSARDKVGDFGASTWYPEADRRFVQLFMAPVTVTDEKVTTYPAIYVWNQDRTASNFTPAWDDFTIPDVPQVAEVY